MTTENPDSFAEAERIKKQDNDIRDELISAKAGLIHAKHRYEMAVRTAREVGWSNNNIAKAVGVTETAIRLFIQRKTGGK